MTSARLIAAALLALGLIWPCAAVFADEAPAEGVVRVGMLRYADDRTSLCFSAGFLDLVGRHTAIRMHRQFDLVPLAADEIHRYPFVVFSGEQAFELPADEAARFRDYVTRGGFVLASAGCSNAAWADSFRRLVAEVFPDQTLEPIASDHPLFRTLFEIRELVGRKPYDGPALWGLTLDDRLAIVFSPLGLNDTAHAGGGCCCCGGNELRNAAQVNANALVYALTH